MTKKTPESNDSQREPHWEFLPARLQGRGDFLSKRGRVKDAELMYDAANEIAALRKQTDEKISP